MSLFSNGGRRQTLRAIDVGGSAAGAPATRARSLALTLVVIAPIVVIYLAIWKFWLTSDFLSSIAATAQSAPVASGSAAGLIEVVKPSDQLGVIMSRSFMVIPIYNSILGSLIPYHAMSFMYIGVLGLTTWVRVTSRPSVQTILTRLWTLFGAVWFTVFAMAELSSAAVDAYISVGFVANLLLAGFTACFLLVSLVRKLRGGEKTA